MHKVWDILYEDNHLIVVNKPAGMLVHGDKTGDETLMEQVKTYLKIKYEKPGDVFLGLVHRIDRPVSGAVIFARTSKGLTRMNKLFSERKVEKIYHAVVERRPPQYSDQISHFLAKDNKKNLTHIYLRQKKNAKKAVLNYLILYDFPHAKLLEVRPITGRPHQIRAQLKAIGCPIVGDLKYGYPRPNPDKSISLHCRKMTFTHPVTKKPVIIEASYPKIKSWDDFR